MSKNLQTPEVKVSRLFLGKIYENVEQQKLVVLKLIIFFFFMEKYENMRKEANI